jgi:hypothetical protein
MLMAAPDRTDSKSGFVEEPNWDFMSLSTSDRDETTSVHRLEGRSAFQRPQNSRQHSVEMVNPGGTARPMADISARFAPFPPKICLSDTVPSTSLQPKKEIGGWSNPSSACTLSMDVDGDGDVAVCNGVVGRPRPVHRMPSFRRFVVQVW